MYCPECGKQIPDDSVFCPECGRKIELQKMSAAEENKCESTKKKNGFPAWWIIALILIFGGLIIKYFINEKGNEDNPEPDFGTETTGYVPDSMAEETAEISVRSLSTDDFANAQDFEWFLDYELSDGSGAGRVITEPGAVDLIQGDGAYLLNGGWKAYMLDTQSVPCDPNSGRFFNVNIDTDNNSFDVTINWKYLILPYSDETIEEEGSDLFKGRWDSENAAAKCQSDFGTLEFSQFYITPDYSAEYAIGTFTWISGEIGRIALMRTEN